MEGLLRFVTGPLPGPVLPASYDAGLVVLEGTMCGSAPFAAARKEGDKLFKESAAGGKPVQVLDIQALRKIGFTPVPR